MSLCLLRESAGGGVGRVPAGPTLWTGSKTPKLKINEGHASSGIYRGCRARMRQNSGQQLSGVDG